MSSIVREPAATDVLRACLVKVRVDNPAGSGQDRGLAIIATPPEDEKVLFQRSFEGGFDD
jgi:hypothetical protein